MTKLHFRNGFSGTHCWTSASVPLHYKLFLYFFFPFGECYFTGFFFFFSGICSAVFSHSLVKQCSDSNGLASPYLIKYTVIPLPVGSNVSCLCHSEAGVMLAYGQFLLLEWYIRPQSCSANTESLSLSHASSLPSLWCMACLHLRAFCVSSSWLVGAALLQWGKNDFQHPFILTIRCGGQACGEIPTVPRSAANSMN